MQGCFEVEVTEVKAIVEGLKLSIRIFDPLLVEFDALNVINLCVGKLISRCEVNNVPDLNVQEVQSRHFPKYNNDRNFAEYLQEREFEEKFISGYSIQCYCST
ncbi:hypothetical protein ACOSQ2_012869 [Xanthoceras sorbifolium]